LYDEVQTLCEAGFSPTAHVLLFLLTMEGLRNRRKISQNVGELSKDDLKPLVINQHRHKSLLYSGTFVLYTLSILWLAFQLHNVLPKPSSDPRSFSEPNAREVVKELSETIGKRMVGSIQEKMTEDFILAKLHQYQRESIVDWFEVDVQKGSGAHRFDFMGSGKYIV
jgi:hypothetical protein